MIELYQNIKKYRIDKKMSQAELAQKSGYTDRSSIAKIERGDVDLPQSKILLIAKALNVTPGTLMGKSGLKHTGVKIPVLGRVVAGIPIEAVEEIIDYEEISEEMARGGEYFGLKIRGDSMEPRMKEGDIVIVRKQEDAESGETIIAMVNGHDACCKRLMKYAGGMQLLSNNPAYEPMMFTDKDIESNPVRILGKVVELRAKF